jgi:hypothetical protein
MFFQASEQLKFGRRKEFQQLIVFPCYVIAENGTRFQLSTKKWPLFKGKLKKSDSCPFFFAFKNNARFIETSFGSFLCNPHFRFDLKMSRDRCYDLKDFSQKNLAKK